MSKQDSYIQTFFPSAIRLWNTAISRQFQDPSQQVPFHLSTGLYVLFISSALRCFYRRSLFIVSCTAFSIHICLFTRGAILLGIESAPLSEDEDEYTETC